MSLLAEQLAYYRALGVEAKGRVFFVDDALRTPEELMDGASSSTVRRRLDDRTPYRS